MTKLKNKKARDLDVENKCMDTKRAKREGEELGNWDCHIYTVDTIYKIVN